jgi:GntR family transcriptional regulator, transcriptional repressor for pyruvate dehydrogenase complex
MAEVLRLGRNPAIALFLHVTSQIGRLNQSREQVFAARPELAEIWRQHAIKLGRAILEGDERLAALFAERGAELNRLWLPKHERLRLTDTARIGAVPADAAERPEARLSLARGAADTLRATILAHPPGAFIGAEEELAARLKVSRHTLRQAAAIAQHDGLLEIRRGVNGGYVGRRPDIDSVVDAVALYLELNEGTLRDLMGASQSLAEEACRMAVASQAPDYVQRLEGVRTQLEAVGGPLDEKPGRSVLRVEQAVMDTLVELAGDTTIELFVRSLYRYGGTLNQPVRAGVERVARWRDARLRLVEELLERDGEAAAVVCHRTGDLLDEWLTPDPPEHPA